MKVSTYIDEEVERQGFVPGTHEYGQRCYWMLTAWHYALDHHSQAITIPHILEVARLVEREVNANGFRRVGVTVGGRVCLSWSMVPRAVENLVAAIDKLDPDSFYYEYEWIHPFGDGNGRSGKVLYNWLKHTLSDPVLPPDFFGAGIP